MTCISCGAIFTANQGNDDCPICPECWEAFRKKKPHEQLKELILKTGGEHGKREVVKG